MIKKYIERIIIELSQACAVYDDSNIDTFIDRLLSSYNIVCAGAGRTGYVSRAFSMRLSHLGLNSFYYEDTNVPHLSSQDLLVIASGSGETKTMINLAHIAKDNNMKIALITSKPKSPIAKTADIIIKFGTPTKIDKNPTIDSIQPMTTLTEQFLFIFYDAVVLELIKKLHLSKNNSWLKHSNLE